MHKQNVTSGGRQSVPPFYPSKKSANWLSSLIHILSLWLLLGNSLVYAQTLLATDIDSSSPSHLRANQPPVASLTVSPTEGKAPLLITADASGSSDPDGSIVKFEWFVDGESLGLPGDVGTIKFTFEGQGTYFIAVTITDNHGLTATEQQKVKVTSTTTVVNQPPVANFTLTPTQGEAPLTVNVDASNSSDDEKIASYQWKSSDGQTVTGVKASFTFKTAGDYTLVLTVTDDQGLTATKQQTVQVMAKSVVNQPPVVNFTVTPMQGEAPLIVKVDASDSSDEEKIASYQWQVSDGQTAAGVKTSFTFETAGNYTITLTVTDNKGATAIQEETVEVTAKTVQPSSTTLPSLGENFSGGIAVNDQPPQPQAVLKIADTVDVTGAMTVNPSDVGKTADIFVYAEATLPPFKDKLYFMLGEGLTISLWDENPANLVAFQPNVTLGATQSVSMYSGNFVYPGTLKIYFGYRLAGGMMVRNNQPIDIIISSSDEGSLAFNNQEFADGLGLCATPPVGWLDDNLSDDSELTLEGALFGVVLKDSRWPNGKPVQVSFDFQGQNFAGIAEVCRSISSQDTCERRVKDEIINAASVWSQYGNIRFQFEVPWNEGEIRIRFSSSGGWGRSSIGTDALTTSKDKETLHLGVGYGLRSVTIHEFGHAIGFWHEHQSPKVPYTWNREQVYNDAATYWEWNRDQVEDWILRPLNNSTDSNLFVTEYDPLSIMVYQIPSSWVSATDKANPESCPSEDPYYCVYGSKELSETDKWAVAQMYPFSNTTSSCNFSISSITQSFNSFGGTDHVNVMTQNQCVWTAFSNAGWITMTSGSNGQGAGTVSYLVSSNSDTVFRTGTLTIAGKTFTVTQEGIEESQVCLYDEVSYQGWEKCFEVNQQHANFIELGINDQVSSLEVFGDVQVELYEAVNYQGNKWVYTENIPWIGWDANDKFSSIRVLPSNNEEQVCLYDAISYQGWKKCFEVNQQHANFIELGINDQISSLEILGDIQVELYEAINYKDNKWVYTESTPWIGWEANDKFSSIRVLPR